ncbi:MAG TPA: hypothetical protein PLU94_05490, partial [Methanoregulaceae archaeon]|nr:hypothetical protein [Methanoregulaceae archaeon]
MDRYTMGAPFQMQLLWPVHAGARPHTPEAELSKFSKWSSDHAPSCGLPGAFRWLTRERDDRECHVLLTTFLRSP